MMSGMCGFGIEAEARFWESGERGGGSKVKNRIKKVFKNRTPVILGAVFARVR